VLQGARCLPVSLAPMSRKLQQKQDRRRAEQKRREAQRRAARRSNLITIGIIAVVAVAVVAGILFETNSGDDNAPANVGVSASAAGCADVETSAAEDSRDHVPDGTNVDYKTDPPTSGNHYANPADPAFYPAPVEPERLVHNLEHGQIVIWYSPDAPGKVKDELESIQQQEPGATTVSPYEGIDDPYNFALTAWVAEPQAQGVIERCEQVSQDVVDDFRRQYQGRGPEQLTPRFTD
jgi:hypothetical protein